MKALFARKTKQRTRQEPERCAATVAGLRSAATWLEAHPGVVPASTTIGVPLPTAQAVRDFAAQHNLQLQQTPGLLSCPITFGPVVIEAYAWTANTTTHRKATNPGGCGGGGVDGR